MPRHARGSIAHSFVHVTTRGNRGVDIFLDDDDRLFFLRRLQECTRRHETRVHAYCLLTNHVHLLVEAGEVPVSRAMQGALQSHAQYINRRYGHRGHLFGDRFWSNICAEDAYLLEVLRYIHLNPVRAGLAATPEEYPWSSHRAYLGLADGAWIATRGILKMFGQQPGAAVREYVRFIEEALPMARSSEVDRLTARS